MFTVLVDRIKFIKKIKNDLALDRTSDNSTLANHLNLYFSCAVHVLQPTLRIVILQYTELSNAQPNTVMLRLFKVAMSVILYKDPIKCNCPTNAL